VRQDNLDPEQPVESKWECKIPEEEGGGFDHDWQYTSDWSGDPGVIGGTYNIYTKRCRACGHEEECGPEDMPTLDDDVL
jgi:hypothetical protein